MKPYLLLILAKVLVYEEGKAIALRGSYSTEDDKINSKTYKQTIGEREHLLCSKCDNERIGLLERKFKEYIAPIKKVSFSNAIAFLNVKYKTLKLFQLSLLWRASITKNNMFSNVSLGIKHEEKIRRMLLENNPGKYYEYGCITIVVRHEYLQRSIFNMHKEKYKRHTRYIIITPGIHFDYYVSSHMNTLDVKNNFLQENGALLIRKAPPEYEKEAIKRLENIVKVVEENKTGNYKKP